MSKTTKTPPLRFPDSAPWEEKRLGGIFSIGNGKDYKHLSKGSIPVYGTGGYMTSVSEYLYDGPSVCIGRKGTIDEPQYLEGKFWTVDTLFYTYGFGENFPYFIYCLFQTIDWKSHNAASGVPSLSKTTIQSIDVKIPTSPAEQRRIGEFFRELDALVAAREESLWKLESLKKAMLQKMFPQGHAKTPEVRFKGFEGEWEVNKLDKWLVVSDAENRDGHFTVEDVLSVSGDYGVVNQIEFQGRSFAGASLIHYRVLKKGQVVYTKSPLKCAPFGIVKTNLFQDGIVSSLYGVYDAIGADSAFVQYYFGSLARLNNYLRPLVNKGAKNTLLISDGDAISGYVCFPSLLEQQKIGKFFRSLDTLLAARRVEVGKLRDLKKALLERMFV